MSVKVFGIRHHGPGSARSLVRSLQTLQPDIVLVEGPPDANDAIPSMGDGEMTPPVALLIYAPDQLEQAAFYPFAVFSPEWQAIQYGLQNDIPVRFMDLPQTHQMAQRVQRQAAAEDSEVGEEAQEAALSPAVQSDREADPDAGLPTDPTETDFTRSIPHD
nr:DUF5682 family protein [Leptolyngbyaceae cyanobacterium MO_188.B28]